MINQNDYNNENTYLIYYTQKDEQIFQLKK